jgi:anti-sigma B factor antagonist
MIESSETNPQPDRPFDCDVSYAEDRAIVVPQGELDLAAAPALLREVRSCLSLRVVGVIVDCEGVTFLDSAGVHALVAAHREAVEHGIAFTLTSVPLQARKVLEITGLAESFGLVTRPGGVLHLARGGPDARA